MQQPYKSNNTFITFGLLQLNCCIDLLHFRSQLVHTFAEYLTGITAQYYLFWLKVTVIRLHVLMGDTLLLYLDYTVPLHNKNASYNLELLWHGHLSEKNDHDS